MSLRLRSLPLYTLFLFGCYNFPVIPPNNEAPIAASDDLNTGEDQALTIDAEDLLENDSDDGNNLQIEDVQNAINGTVDLSGDTITFTPDPNVNGDASFEYTVSDGDLTDTASVSITIAPIDDAPQANNDTLVTDEDTGFTVLQASLLFNDVELDDEALNLVAVDNAVSGTVALSGSDVVFTPDTNFNGIASFEYTVSDGNSTDIAQVSVTVNPVNDAPVAANDADTTDEDIPLSLDAATLLANDSDVDAGDILSITSVQNAQNGSVTIDQTQITFTPDANFNGTASFEYTVEDGNGGSDTALVTITVNAVNDPPVAADDTFNALEDTPATIPQSALLTNDIDVDGDTLDVTAVANPQNGSVVISGADVVFTPDANFNGVASFEYTVEDGNGGSDIGLVTLNVDDLNAAPVAVDDAFITDEDIALPIDVDQLLANDIDSDGDILTVSSVQLPQNGSVALAGGVATFTPDLNFSGTASFEYTVFDGVASDTALVTITVNAVNDPPVAADDQLLTDEDTAIVIPTIGLLANDIDAEDDTLTVISVQNIQSGAVVFNALQITFTPDADFNGTASFEYTVSDGNGGSDTALVTITVNAVNDPPVAADDSASTNEDVPVVIPAATLLANDIDVDGDLPVVIEAINPVDGSVVLNGTDITFTPDADFNGDASFEYTVSDGIEFDTAVVTVTVAPVDDLPAAVNDSDTTDEDTPVTTNVLANDSGLGDGGILVTVLAQPANGVAVVNGNNSVTFTPNADFNGSDSYTYQVADADGDLDVATVSLTVNAVDDLPIAVNDADTTNEDTPVTTNVLANDQNLGDGGIVVSITVQPANGAAVVNGGNTVTFTPNADFNGSDSYTYQVADADGDTSTATVSLVVDPVNDVPVAVNDSDTTDEDLAVTTNVLANDLGLGDGGIVVSITVQPINGTAVVNGDNTVTFTPDADANGADVYTYSVQDSNGDSDTAVVTVTVTPVDDVVDAVDDTDTTDEDIAVTTNVLANDLNLGDGGLVVTVVAQPANGAAVVNGDNTVTFTPDANANGADVYTYSVQDIDGDLDVAAVTVTVNPVNDAPIADDDVDITDEDVALSLNVGLLLANDDVIDAGDNLSMTSVQNAQNGSAVLNGAQVDFTPDPDFNGTASFEYTVSDGTLTDTGLVTIIVDPFNDPPVAADDSAVTDEDVPVVIPAADLLLNDSDVENDTLTVTSVQNAQNGAAVLNGTDVTFTPTADFNGAASFEYTVSDGNGGSDTGLVAVTVNPVVVCGDGDTDAPEECDDGDLIDGDGCDSNCTVTACGNGVLTSGEECDDGNTQSGDGCNAACVIELCGDGVVVAGELCFLAQTTFAVGDAPNSVTAGDFNGDGNLDLAAANRSSNDMSVLLGDGAGSFGAQTTFATDADPRAITAGDFDGDSDLDIAIANSAGANSVSIHLNDGLGSFGAGTSFDVGLDPRSITVGDFDGDGNLDIATANVVDNSLSVLLGNGDGTFATQTSFAVGIRPFSIAVGLFNNDANLDLVTANDGSNSLSVLLGDGAGGFGAQTTFATGAQPRSVTVGDFNGDSNPDLVTANQGSSDLSVLLGDGAGNFGPQTAFFSATIPTSVAVSDFDNDGNLDLAAANLGLDNLRVFLGDGLGSFGTSTPFDVGLDPLSIVAGDFDNDGVPDLATANEDSDDLSVILSNP